MNLIIKPLF